MIVEMCYVSRTDGANGVSRGKRKIRIINSLVAIGLKTAGKGQPADRLNIVFRIQFPHNFGDIDRPRSYKLWTGWLFW